MRLNRMEFQFPTLTVLLISLNGRIWTLRSLVHFSAGKVFPAFPWCHSGEGKQLLSAAGRSTPFPSWSSINHYMSYLQICINPTHRETPKLP